MASDPLHDPLLRAVPVVGGYKVLPPCVLLKQLGEGGMGKVYRGFHASLTIDVAVKCLAPRAAHHDPSNSGRFEREAQLGATINHQNVVRVYDARSAFGLQYLVMELVRGETARERVARKGPLPEREVLGLVVQAARGLAAIHGSNVVHRDIKPQNLLIARDGTVKVADLGIARPVTNLATTAVIGTRSYMAPEQYQNHGIGPPADVWALGGSLYTLLTNTDPDPARGLATCVRELKAERQGLSPGLLAILERCCQTKPADRFADASEMLAALTALPHATPAELRDDGAGEGGMRTVTLTRPPSHVIARAVQTTTSTPRRLFASTLAAACAMCLVAGGVAWGLTRSPGDAGAGKPNAPGPEGGKPDPDPAGTPPLEPTPTATDSAAPAPVAPSRAQLAFERGNAALPSANRLDEAIAAFEECARLDSSYPGLVAALSAAYDAKVTALGQSDLPAAYDLASRWVAFANTAGARASQQDLARALRERLRSGIQITPADGALVGRDVTVTAAVQEALVRDLKLGALDIVGENVPLVAGVAKRRVEFAQDGDAEVGVRARFRDLEADLSRRLVVDTQAPQLDLADLPRETEAAEISVSGTAVDPHGPVRVEVAGQRSGDRALATTAGADGAFALRVGLTLGDNRLAVTARDARDNVVERRVVVRRKAEVVRGRLPEGWDAEVVAAGDSETGLARKVKDKRTGIVFLLVEPGEFGMGSNAGYGDERPVHPVRITQSFYMAETETSQKQWKRVLPLPRAPGFAGDDLPVENVSWFEVQWYLKELNGGAEDGPFRLPTEAEWEYCCRAGTTTEFSFGDTISTDQANYNGNFTWGNGKKGVYRQKTTAVGSFPPNAWGFRDMHGNVWEWCQDWYAQDYYQTCGDSVQDPQGAASGTGRALRGGSWRNDPGLVRSAGRGRGEPTGSDGNIGFRCVRVPRRQR